MRPYSLFVSSCILAFVIAATAQSPNDVHITPQSKSSPNTHDDHLKIHTRPIRIDVDLVLIPVTVTNVDGSTVTDLRKDDFHLFERDQERPIQYFFSQDGPISIGLVVDLSSSMGNKLDLVREAVNEFFNNADPADDFFVVTFSDKARLFADTTTSIGTIQAKLAQMKAKGNTALADAIYMALHKLRTAQYQRRALLVISDGGDNASRHTLRSLKRLAKESDAQVYAIDVCDAPAVLLTRKLEERLGRRWLSQVSQVTGGRTIAVDNAARIPSAAAAISLELRNQYVLGFRPGNVERDGKWRKIKVKVSRTEEQQPVQLYYRTGYLARKEAEGE